MSFEGPGASGDYPGDYPGGFSPPSDPDSLHRWDTPYLRPPQPPPLPPPRGPRSKALRAASVMVLAFVVALAGALAGRASFSSGAPASPKAPATKPGGGSAVASDVATKVDPSIVDVDSLLGVEGGAAAGTGMVLTSTGEVLTNNHVIEQATAIKVTDIGNNRTYDATVVGTDKAADIAVLQLSGASDLSTARLGNSSNLRVAEAVTAIGNAGGAGGAPSVTTGHVAALNQGIIASDEVDGSQEELSGLVQTTAPLQPGDSGGPLVDNSAHVVAMDTAASANYQFQSGPSASYAIPINFAISVARQIEAGEGSATIHIGPAAFLGVKIETARSLPGALVDGVQAGSPAQSAGIGQGDVIVSFSGQSVTSATALLNLMAQHHPGDVVQIVWVDPAGNRHSAAAPLAAGPPA